MFSLFSRKNTPKSIIGESKEQTNSVIQNHQNYNNGDKIQLTRIKSNVADNFMNVCNEFLSIFENSNSNVITTFKS